MMYKSNMLRAAQAHPVGGYWGTWRETVRATTIHAVYDRFEETGRFDAWDFDWKEGEPNRPHIFWDSDIAKWMESAAYLLLDERDETLEMKIDTLVDKLEAHQNADGYFNSYFAQLEPEARFTRYTDHELYCLGHLLEAAVAYAEATGKRKLLNLLLRYVHLVDRVFRVEHSAGFDTPGHEEIELALYKLYQYTRDADHLELMRYFIEARGRSERDKTYDVFAVSSYAQAHKPVREQTTAEGHAVRAMYLYCAMADLARETDDESLLEACRTLFSNIVNRRMYITGGIGSSRVGEAFTFDYDLMNRTAYAETCAALGLALFARRMSLCEPNSIYADAAERALYNGAMAGISLAGDSFFYENPLEVHPDLYYQNQRYAASREHVPQIHRQKVFECSCCPPNLTRVIASIGEFALSSTRDTLFVHHYMELEAQTDFGTLQMHTGYPYDGDISLRIGHTGYFTLALRVPGWAQMYTLSVNGRSFYASLRDGYLYIPREFCAGDVVELKLPMPVRQAQAHPALHENCGRVAVLRGPLVYCLEQADNGAYLKDVAIDKDAKFNVLWDEELHANVLRTMGSRRAWLNTNPLYTEEPISRVGTQLTFVPYACWGNRGEGEMLVWLMRG